jgi:hypothetical protein
LPVQHLLLQILLTADNSELLSLAQNIDLLIASPDHDAMHGELVECRIPTCHDIAGREPL